jgi:hypothetical protein
MWKMTLQVKYIFAAAVFTVYVSVAHAGSLCDGVDRSLTTEHRSAWAPEVAKQLSVSSVEVLQSFRLDGWNILYVDTHQSDEAFLFYARDPLTSHYWALKNAPNIPLKLASCFAWHVTKDRDK